MAEPGQSAGLTSVNGATVARLAAVFVACALLLGGASRYVGRLWIVDGHSMEPALVRGDWVVVDRWTYRHRLPRPGEIVLLELPDSGRWGVKRVQSVSSAGLRVLGDNAAVSRDSREFGAVPRAAIVGRVVLRLSAPGR